MRSWGLHDGISALGRRGKQRSLLLSLSLCLFLFFFFSSLSTFMHKEKPIRVHSEKAITYKPRNKSSPGAKSSITLTLDFPGSRTLRNKCVLFKLHGLWYFCYSSLSRLSNLRVKNILLIFIFIHHSALILKSLSMILLLK